MHSLAWWPTLITLSVATFTDLRSRRIPNWLVFPFFTAGVAVSGWLGGWHGIGQSAMGFGLGLVLFGGMFLMGGMGAGDVKLAAAIGAWIGPMQLFFALIATAIAGGIMALAWMVVGRLRPAMLKGTGDLADEQNKDQVEGANAGLGTPVRVRVNKLPYAPAIALGTLLSFFAR